MTINFNCDRGLFLDSSSTSSESSLEGRTAELCHNFTISREGILQKRRGYTRKYVTVSNLDYILNYNGDLYIIEDSTLKRLDDDFTVVSTYNELNTANEPIHALANNNLYVLGEDRVLKLDGTSGTLKNAGINKALDITVESSGISGVIKANSQCAYRVTFAYEDNNNNKIVSAPSNLVTLLNPVKKDSVSLSSLVITVTSVDHGLTTGDNIEVSEALDNTGSIVNISGTFTVTVVDDNSFTFDLLNVPSSTPTSIEWGTNKTSTVEAILSNDVQEGYICQIYRSSFSVDSTVEPLEDLQLVDEITVTSTDIDNSFISYIDEIPESLRQGFLYTNPAQEGIVSSNEPPPVSKTLAFFKSCLFYANTKELARRRVTLVTVSTMSIGDEFKIKIGGTTHTFIAGVVEDSSLNQFLLKNDSSVSINIDTTTRSIASVINRSDIGIACYYLSSVNDAPGQLMLEATTYTIDSFILNTNVEGMANCFSPAVPVTGDDYFGKIEENTNKVMFSKAQEPEAVPLGNFLNVGAKNESIVALQALRDSLVVLTDQAIYRISGESPSEFYVRSIDTSTKCIANKTVARLNDNVLFLSSKGICSVNENSVQVISGNINSIILNTLEKDTVDQSTALSYASEGTYQITMLKENAKSNADIITYVYSADTGVWVTSDVTFSNSTTKNNRLVLVSADKTSIIEERKNRLTSDFADSLNDTCTIVSKLSSARLILDTADVSIGDALFNNTEYLTISNEINKSSTSSEVIITSVVESEEAAEFRLDKKIVSSLTTAPIYLSRIDLNKNFSEVQLQYRNDASCSNIKINFSNDVTFSKEIELGLTSREGWGLEEWVNSKWGSESNLNRDYGTSASNLFRTYVSRECMRSRFIQISLLHDRIEPIELQNINLRLSGSSGSKKTR